MGNQNSRSRDNGGARSSKKRWQPSELYDSCLWEEKTVRRMINRGKLAPSLRGKDERETGNERDCPICLHHYDEVNRLKCCKATICTECYLQVQEPIDQMSPCPFCKCRKMIIVPTKQLNLSEAAKREKDEQKVIEAKIQARKNSELLSIQLPQQDQSSDYSVDLSLLDSKSNGGEASDRPLYFDIPEINSLDSQYRQSPRFEVHGLVNFDSPSQDEFSSSTRVLTERENRSRRVLLDEDDLLELSEETQIALAIRMSLRGD